MAQEHKWTLGERLIIGGIVLVIAIIVIAIPIVSGYGWYSCAQVPYSDRCVDVNSVSGQRTGSPYPCQPGPCRTGTIIAAAVFIGSLVLYSIVVYVIIDSRKRKIGKP